MIFSAMTDEQLLRYFRDTPIPSAWALEELILKFENLSAEFNKITGGLEGFSYPVDVWYSQEDLHDYCNNIVETIEKYQDKEIRVANAFDFVINNKILSDSEKLEHLIQEITE